MPSERMIGGLTVMIGGKTAPNNRKLYRHKIMDTIAYYQTRLVVSKDTNNFLSFGETDKNRIYPFLENK